MFEKFKENLKKTLSSLIVLSIGILIFIPLLTYNQSDNSFLKYDSNMTESKNALGFTGSIISELLLEIFGSISYFLGSFFVFHSIRVLFSKEMSWYCWGFLPISLIILCFGAEFMLMNFNFANLDGGVLGLGLLNYFNYFFEGLEYKQLIFLIICFLAILSVLVSLNLGIGEIISSFNFFKNIFVNTISLVLYVLKLSNQLKLRKLFESRKTQKILKSKPIIKRKVSYGIKNSENYVFPSIELLEKPKKISGLELENKKNTELNTAMLANVLTDFKINGNITDVRQGPIVTLFELTPAPGTQSSSVIRLADDIARSMRATSARISTISGKDALGIEIPNKNRETVFLREILDEVSYKSTNYKLPLALGKDIFGKPVIVDLARMPHLLVAGTTGSGKSVGINAMLLSLLYTLTPEECRLILIDPKMLELSVYKDIPHLLTEVVTDPKKAISALKWTVKEMETRYKMMAHLGVREIEDYNKKVKKILEDGEVIFKETQVGFDSETGKPLMEKKALDLSIFAKIVVVVDELADLMITSGKEIESAIQRLSQMARAAGIHLIVATQRPSVDVITGTIKSNFPTRISYKVVNKINSRTILEEQGAEQLLGQGDLLITMLGERLLRVHGPYVKTDEVQAVVDHLKTQGEPEYLQSVTIEEEELENIQLGFNDGGDELYNQAVSIVCREKRASTSFIQRHLKIGYNRAASIVERMESEGIVSPANHIGRREVLVGKET
ncbi:MAG: cell division protein FtsK [Rickettsiales bacterium]|nr:cell division protein FtsK [Rickettsiales bacterium]